MRRLIIVFSITIMFLGLLAVPATRTNATMLEKKDFQDMSKEADLVFVGTVLDIYSEWDGEAYHSEIYTYVTFTDLEIIAGDYHEGKIQVRLSGGKVGKATRTYIGVPTFNFGERNLVFLTGNFLRLCPIVGWNQGVFKVVEDQETGEEVLYSYRGVLVEEIKNNKFTVNRKATKVTGGPGIPDTVLSEQVPHRAKLKVDSEKKLSLKHLTKKTREKRAQLKREGETLGYMPPNKRTKP